MFMGHGAYISKHKLLKDPTADGPPFLDACVNGNTTCQWQYHRDASGQALSASILQPQALSAIDPQAISAIDPHRASA
jgi:hypothetical protein